MNESLMVKIKCEAARKVIYHQHLQIESMRLRLDKLEQLQHPTKAIGFNQNPITETMEIAFPSSKFKGGD